MPRIPFEECKDLSDVQLIVFERERQHGPSDVMPNIAVMVAVEINDGRYAICIKQDIVRGKILMGNPFGTFVKEFITKLFQYGFLRKYRFSVFNGGA